jgi:hypothetical protein
MDASRSEVRQLRIHPGCEMSARIWAPNEVLMKCAELGSQPVIDEDLRDLPVTACRRISRIAATRTNFTHSSWANVWLEDSTFISCDFTRADLQGLKDHGNRFDRCTFRYSLFGHAALGYQGTQFVDCTFERARFRGAAFARAVFTRCKFVDCGLIGIDFLASRFTNCTFVGELNEVCSAAPSHLQN